jgi:hypothetical protein
MLSNLDLVRDFVHHSSQNQEVLLGNSILSSQTICRNNQLIAKKEGVIMYAHATDTQTKFLIKASSSHWELMNQVLAEYGYLLQGEIDSRGFYEYHAGKVPKGYQMHCTRSVMLWRAWWKYRKYASRIGIPMNLLIRRRDSWYPVKDLIISNGTVYIKTLGSEIALGSEDLITWLNKIEVSPLGEQIEENSQQQLTRDLGENKNEGTVVRKQPITTQNRYSHT